MRHLMLIAMICGLLQSWPAAGKAKRSFPRKFVLAGLSGGSFASAELGKGYTLVQFWASWCKSCGSTLAALSGWTAKNSHIRLVSISVDEDLASARRYFAAGPAELRPLQKYAYFDAGAKIATALNVEALPAVLLISPKGEVVQDLGGHPSEAALSKALTIVGNVGRAE